MALTWEIPYKRFACYAVSVFKDFIHFSYWKYRLLDKMGNRHEDGKVYHLHCCVWWELYNGTISLAFVSYW
jgi:hypothetical protein